MSGLPGLLGLDRKAMEEERLARTAKKRTADVALDMQSKRLAKMPKTERSREIAVSAAQVASEVSKGSIVARPIASMTTKSLQYPHGIIKKTWALGYERHNDCKIEEVLQKSDLTTALISSWQWDFNWLVRKLQPSKTKFIFVMEAKSQADKDRLRGDFVGLENSIRLCFPPMSGNIYARMHSKLMLLFHPSHLRIVIPSANPIGHDWGESGLLENTLFMIDIPRLPKSKQGSPNPTMTPFATDLVHFLDAMQISDDVKNGVLSFDFTATLNLAFVHSIPGSFDVDSQSRTGLLSISHAVRTLDLATPPDNPFDAQFATASLGALDTTQVDLLDRALRGLDPLLGPRSSAKGKPLPKDDAKLELISNGCIQILFPSRETVMQSKGGVDAAGTIFLKASSFDQLGFPRRNLREYVSRRAGLLSHNKLILVRSSMNAFLYNGSANFSQSAWGRISFPKGAKVPKITVANWECGILIPVVRQGLRIASSASEILEGVAATSNAAVFTPETGQMIDTLPSSEMRTGKNKGNILKDEHTSATYERTTEVLPMSVFDGLLDIPFEWPAKEYQDAQRPWCTK